MLIRVSKLVQCGERWVPSVIRLYCFQQKITERFGNGPLFLSIIDGTYQSLPCIANREEYLSTSFRYTERGYITVVKCGSEVGDGITKDEAETWANRLTLEFNRMAPRVWVHINPNRITFRGNGESPSFKISNVLFGPV